MIAVLRHRLPVSTESQSVPSACLCAGNVGVLHFAQRRQGCRESLLGQVLELSLGSQRVLGQDDQAKGVDGSQ